MDIAKEKLVLLYKIQKSWPEMWKWIQLQANKESSLEDVVYVLENYWAQKSHVITPWAYCTIALQQRVRRNEDRKREIQWDEKKEQEKGFAEQIAELIRGIVK